MNITFKSRTWVSCLSAALLTAQAGEIGHYAPGVLSIRDFAMPEPGFYGLVYNYGYTTDRLNDSGGNHVNSVTIKPGPGPGVTLGLDLDVNTPGQNLTVNWGASQYLPLKKDQTLLLEIGPAGYSSWQITDDSGSAAANPAVRDEVHAVGGQIGLTYVPWNATLNFHYFHEFAAEDRFQGQSIGLNFAKKF